MECRVEHNYTPSYETLYVSWHTKVKTVLVELNQRRERACIVTTNNVPVNDNNKVRISEARIVSVTDLLYANDEDSVGKLAKQPINIPYNALMSQAKYLLINNSVRELLVVDPTEDDPLVRGIIWDFQVACGCRGQT